MSQLWSIIIFGIAKVLAIALPATFFIIVLSIADYRGPEPKPENATLNSESVGSVN